MNLRHVPDDEADEIRTLFEAHGIRYYETPPSRWGISMGGFWTHDDGEATHRLAGHGPWVAIMLAPKPSGPNPRQDSA